MDILFIFIYLIIASVALAIILDYRFEQTVILTCFGTIAVLYFFGLIGILKIGVYFSVALVICGFLFSVYKARKTKINLIEQIFTPGFVVCILFFIFFIYINYNRAMYLSDEYVHWGLIVRNMNELDKLGSAMQASTYFKAYTEGISLLQYFFMKISSFRQFNLYLAVNTIMMACLLPIFQKINWKDFWKIPAFGMIIFLIPLIFRSNAWLILMVDYMMGLIVGYILFTYYSAEKKDGKLFAVLALGIFVLTQMKAAGAVLALLINIAIFIDLIFYQRKTMGNKKVGIYFLALMLTLIVSKVSWDLYLAANSVHEASSGGGLSAVFDVFTGKAPAYQYDGIKSFIKGLILTKGSIIELVKGSFLFMMIALCGLFYFSWNIPTDLYEKKRLRTFSITLLIIAVVYIISVLILIATTFSPYEVAVMASSDRYINTIIIGLVAFAIMNLINMKEWKTSSIYIILAVIILFVPIDVISMNSITAPKKTAMVFTVQLIGLLKQILMLKILIISLVKIRKFIT